MWILLKAISIKEFVQDNSFGRQSMKAIILVVLVAELVDSDPFSTEDVVFLLY